MIARLVGPSILERTQNHTLQSGPCRTWLVADLQADSLLWGRNLLSASKEGHIDLPRLVEGNVAYKGSQSSPPSRADSISTATKTLRTWCLISGCCKAGR